jgi:polysaccharide export outer membrane protein
MMTTLHTGISRLRRVSHRAGLLAALALLSVPALAQFNGPASLGGAEINRPVSITTDRDVLYPPVTDTPLVADDLITIHIFGQPDYSPIVRIATDGTVLLPLIGQVHLAGLTVARAQELIAHRLIEDGMYRDPEVNIQITEGPNSFVTVIGEVHSLIPITGKRRLLDILAAAGGLPPTASHVLTINRPGLEDPIIIDLGNDPLHSSLADVPIFAGDTIVVSRLGVVYIIGGFKGIGVYPLSTYNNMTLTQLTALSGGVSNTAKFSQLHIIRTVGNHRTVSTVDIKKVLRGRAPDPYLQPNDILYMPTSATKVVFSTAALSVILSVVTLAITVAYVR